MNDLGSTEGEQKGAQFKTVKGNFFSANLQWQAYDTILLTNRLSQLICIGRRPTARQGHRCMTSVGVRNMGIYSEYLDQHLDMAGLTAERKKQLRRISEIRGGRDVLVYAADMSTGDAPISIMYSDLLAINDQLSNLNGDKLDFILETPGGAGEIAEDIVRLLRGRYEELAVIIPGCAKSAGTILAMAGDEILMEPVSALGPIDAQISWQGKVFSADALLDGMEKIKEEVARSGVLNKAYVPILQGISPGELQSAENALTFAKVLVTDWLARYKFKYWSKHSNSEKPVTDEEKRARAEEIAEQLCDHGRWLTHGRSIKLDDLSEMRLKVTDYSEQPELAEAIRRYYTLLEMTFASNIYKVFETPDSQIYRGTPVAAMEPQAGQLAISATVEAACRKCGKKTRIQADFDKEQALKQGHVRWPKDSILPCPNCGDVLDLSELRRAVEAQAGKPIVT